MIKRKFQAYQLSGNRNAATVSAEPWRELTDKLAHHNLIEYNEHKTPRNMPVERKEASQLQ